jgi:hypothetical protein
MNPVLDSLSPILDQSRYVFVDKEKIKELAPKLAEQDMPIPDWSFPAYIEEDSTHTIEMFFLANSINFAYTDFETKEKFTKDGFFGAEAMWYSLKKAYEDKVPILSCHFLENLELDQAEEIFRGDNSLPMLEERVAILKQVGQVLRQRYQGRFLNLVNLSNNRAFNNGKGMVERLVSTFPSFNDASRVNGDYAKFYKRAQLAVAMTYGRLNKTGLFDVEDIDDLTVFADYVLPVGFYEMGVFRYKPSLQDRIVSQQLIGKNSREELEIRANTIYAADLLVKEINKHREKKINALNLDAKLWLEGRHSKQPHHLTITTAY